jgi:hypothetical protein
MDFCPITIAVPIILIIIAMPLKVAILIFTTVFPIQYFGIASLSVNIFPCDR